MRLSMLNEDNVRMNLNIVFAKTPLNERRRCGNKELIDTTCKIFCNEQMIADETVRQNPADSYNRIVGKKLALQRALQRPHGLAPYPTGFSQGHINKTRREIRKKIWQEFHRTFGSWN